VSDQPVRDAQAKVMADLRDLIVSNEQVIRDTPLVDEANYDNILWLIETGLNRNNLVPVDKTGRWIGFVQCALIVRRVLDTKTERDQTRALFHAAYLATGQVIPETLNRPNTPEEEAVIRLAKAAEAARHDPGEDLSGLSDDEFISRLIR
jgi:hypothetical protein